MIPSRRGHMSCSPASAGVCVCAHTPSCTARWPNGGRCVATPLCRQDALSEANLPLPTTSERARAAIVIVLHFNRSHYASQARHRTFYELPAAYNVHGSSRWATSTSMSSNDSLSARSTSLDGFRDAFIVHAHRGRQVAHPLYVSRERRWRRQAEALLPGVRALEREGAMLGR